MMQLARGPGRPGSGDDTGDGLRHFVNHLKIDLSLAEIRFDLGMLGARPLEAWRVWRFVTTPDYMQAMHSDLTRALTSYRERYGAIRSPEEGDG